MCVQPLLQPQEFPQPQPQPQTQHLLQPQPQPQEPEVPATEPEPQEQLLFESLIPATELPEPAQHLLQQRFATKSGKTIPPQD